MERNETIEAMLAGRMDMSSFLSLLGTDASLREYCEHLIPTEAVFHPEHPIWNGVICYETAKNNDFDFLKYMKRLRCFCDTMGGHLNLSSTMFRAYGYYFPEIQRTEKYQKAYNLYLDSVAEYYEGPEVEPLLEQIINEALFLPTKAQRVKAVRQRVRELFHITTNGRPYWIQGGEWPMGSRSPMAYCSRKKISDGVAYTFQDVDTGELRIVEQYY